jgi:septal ring-binding cell division protein DamX
MFNWLGKMLGIVPAEAASEAPAAPTPAPAAKKPAAKKPAAKKPAAKKPAAKKAAPKAKAEAKPKAEKKPAAKKAAKKDDGLDAMNKRDLLALAKEKKVKANASMNKEAVIKAIRSA